MWVAGDRTHLMFTPQESALGSASDGELEHVLEGFGWRAIAERILAGQRIDQPHFIKCLWASYPDDLAFCNGPTHLRQRRRAEWRVNPGEVQIRLAERGDDEPLHMPCRTHQWPPHFLWRSGLLNGWLCFCAATSLVRVKWGAWTSLLRVQRPTEDPLTALTLILVLAAPLGVIRGITRNGIRTDIIKTTDHRRR